MRLGLDCPLVRKNLVEKATPRAKNGVKFRRRADMNEIVRASRHADPTVTRPGRLCSDVVRWEIEQQSSERSALDVRQRTVAFCNVNRGVAELTAPLRRPAPRHWPRTTPGRRACGRRSRSSRPSGNGGIARIARAACA